MPEQPVQRTTSDPLFPPYDPTSGDRRAGSPTSPVAQLEQDARAFLGIAWRYWRSLFLAAACAGALFGFRIWGPMQEIASVKREGFQRDSSTAANSFARDTALSLRVTRLEDGASAQTSDIRGLKEDFRMLMYLQCESLRRSDRGAPRDCLDYLRSPTAARAR